MTDERASDVSAAAEGDSERLITVARELNAVRSELDDARLRASQAERQVSELQDVHREALLAAAEKLRQEASADKDRALGESAARMESSLREARKKSAGRLREADAARDVALGALEQVTQRAQRAETERDALVEELREARRALKASRADSESFRRERDQLARDLEKAEKVIPRGRLAEEPPGPEAPTAIAPRPAADAETKIQPRSGSGFVPIEDEPLEPGETVRVIGRAPRASRTDSIPEVDAELPPAVRPPVLGYLLAAVIFVIFVVIVVALVL